MAGTAELTYKLGMGLTEPPVYKETFWAGTETYSQWVVGAEDERAFFKYEDQGKSFDTFE